MRTLWTILSVIGAWVSLSALTVALRAASHAPESLTSSQQHQYVNIAWIGFIIIFALTFGAIIMTIRAFRRKR